MKEIKKILVIAGSTFRDSIRDRVLYNLIFASIFLILFSYVLSQVSYGEPRRIALHFGLAALSICAFGIALFIGVGLISKELDSRTIYTIVSKPVSREQFLLGKFFGLSGVLALNFFILSLVLLVLLNHLGYEINHLFLKSILLQFFEVEIVLSMIMFFSTFSTRVFSTMFCLSIWLAGANLPSLTEISVKSLNRVAIQLFSVLSYFLPNFSRFNIKDMVYYGDSYSWEIIFATITYAIVLIISLQLASLIVFKSRDLP